MNKEIEKLDKEREALVAEVEKLEKRKGEIMTRLVEIQGILKYLNENKKEEKNGNT